ncbi:unnamed protein product, partial [Sphagnum jensenii]
PSHTCDEDENNDDGFQEFEFSMSAAASSSTEREAPSSGMSSADELFFKGQLLPLHLPPRLRMVQRLASDSSSSSTDSCRDSTSARDSSSSRDSSGSSQDANFSDSSGSCNKAFQMPPISSDLKGSFLHNREVFGTHVRSFEQQQQRSSSSSSSTISSWLKPPFNGDIERGDHQRGMAKAREYLHKYMKMLKPLHLKKYEQQELDDVSSCRFTGSFSLPSSSLAHETRRHSRNHIAPGNRSFSSSYSSQSSRFASVTADVVGSPRSRSAVGTPTRRGSGRPLSSGSIAELHSAIQGAIAHCKESQTTAKYESL